MSPHGELFHRLLDESSALLASAESAGIAIPDDELHREIIVPLLPAMLADAAIRQHWNEQAATGFLARLARHFENGDPAPRWTPGDFEIHVTASFSAGADARALADTLLSEDSLRDMTAALMNQLLDALWPSLAPAPPETEPAVEIAPPSEPIETPEIPVIEVMPIAREPEPEHLEEGTLPPEASLITSEPARPEELPPPPPQPQPLSRALVRTLCRNLGVSAVQRRLASYGAHEASAAVIARRIFQRAKSAASPRSPTSPRRLPRRASL